MTYASDTYHGRYICSLKQRHQATINSLLQCNFKLDAHPNHEYVLQCLGFLVACLKFCIRTLSYRSDMHSRCGTDMQFRFTQHRNQVFCTSSRNRPNKFCCDRRLLPNPCVHYSWPCSLLLSIPSLPPSRKISSTARDVPKRPIVLACLLGLRAQHASIYQYSRERLKLHRRALSNWTLFLWLCMRVWGRASESITHPIPEAASASHLFLAVDKATKLLPLRVVPHDSSKLRPFYPSVPSEGAELAASTTKPTLPATSTLHISYNIWLRRSNRI